MKKIFISILALALAVSICACGTVKSIMTAETKSGASKEATNDDQKSYQKSYTTNNGTLKYSDSSDGETILRETFAKSYRDLVSKWLNSLDDIDARAMPIVEVGELTSATATITIIFDSMTEETFDDVALRYITWAKGTFKEIESTSNLYLLKGNNLRDFSDSNYKDKVEKSSSKRISCQISSNGTVNLTKENYD